MSLGFRQPVDPEDTRPALNTVLTGSRLYLAPVWVCVCVYKSVQPQKLLVRTPIHAHTHTK